MLKAVVLAGLGTLATAGWMPLHAATFGFADIVVEFFDSGAGPIAGPYGGVQLNTPPVPVSTSVVLGDDPGPGIDFLSLPTGSFVTVGFTDDSIFDGAGNDLSITEVGAAGDQADVFVSSDGLAFTLVGTAMGGTTNAFDLAAIAFADQVRFVKVVGLDLNGLTPGFDLVNVEGLNVVPIPAALPLLASALGALGWAASRRRAA